MAAEWGVAWRSQEKSVHTLRAAVIAHREIDEVHQELGGTRYKEFLASVSPYFYAMRGKQARQ